MTRRPQWERLLVEWAVGQLGQPFVWGAVDCVQLWRGALVTMYGRDLVRLPGYHDPASAEKGWEETGGTAPILAALGARAMDLPFSQQGDIVVSPGEPFARSHVLVDRKLLSVEPGDVVRWYELASVPDGSVAWRVP